MKAKVTQVVDDVITFIDEEGFGTKFTLYSDHNSSCCEWHYLDMKDLTMEDFEGLEFDLMSDNFFNRVEGYGIELVPLNGHVVRIPGYASNNGYYSSNLSLIINKDDRFFKSYDITECQDY